MFIETTTLDHLQSQRPEDRLQALEALYRNSCILYGQADLTTLEVYRRLEACRSKFVHDNSDKERIAI